MDRNTYVEKMRALNAVYDEEDKRVKALGWLAVPLALCEYFIYVFGAISGGILAWWVAERFGGMEVIIAFQPFVVPDVHVAIAAIAGTIAGGLLGILVGRESIRVSTRLALRVIHRFA